MDSIWRRKRDSCPATFNPKHEWGLSLSTVLVAVAISANGASCADSKPEQQPNAEAVADELITAIDIAARDRVPILCATWPTPDVATRLDGNDGNDTKAILAELGFTHRGDLLQQSDPIDIALVTDAREPSPPTLATIDKIAHQLNEENIHLVISLGGMGQTAEQLIENLGRLGSRSRVVVASIGDTESVSELAGAVKTLRGRGLPVFSTNEVRRLMIGNTMLGLLPGVANIAEVIPGGDGCLHRESDTQQLAAALRAHDGPRVWLSYVPPLQRPAQGYTIGAVATEATDLSEGVHLGSPHIANAIIQSGVVLAIHGQLASPSPPKATGKLKFAKLKFATQQLATLPPVIAVQPLEVVPRLLGGQRPTTTAVILSVNSSTLSWRRLER